MNPRRPAHAEVVGSLLRPPELQAAVEKRSDPVHLGAVADDAIERVVERQVEIGLDVVSDGEFRRWMFLNSFYDAVEGIAIDRSKVEFSNERGETVVLTVPSIEARLRRIDSPGAVGVFRVRAPIRYNVRRATIRWVEHLSGLDHGQFPLPRPSYQPSS